ncbi:MAG TPA: hypothetical protein VMT16_04800, partial [Thermoanaerobaculia bacterium]|nr:hypothetical protein [Thermoanaerobaculia bacterium]
DSMRYLLVSERRAGPESWGVWLGLEREEEVSAAERLLPVAAPHAFGHDLFGAFWGEQNINVSGAKFAGSVALLLAAVALAPLRRGRRYPQERWALGLALVMLVVLARSPGMAAALLQVPLLRNSASLGGRGAFLLVLALAWLAACACDRWRRHGLDDGRVAMAAGGLAALLAWGYASHPSPQGEEVLLGLRWGTLGLQLATLAGAVSLLWAGRRPRRGGVVAAALVALAASELAVVHWPIHESHPRELFYPPVEPIAFLQDNLGDDRMVALTYMLPANIPALYGLSDVRIADPLEPVAYSQLVGPLRMEGHFTTAALDAPEHPLYDLLGVRLVLGPWGRQLDPPIHRVFARGSSWIWERPGALPRLFLPQSAEVAAEPKWWRWSRQRPEYARRALAEAVPGHQEGWQAQRPAPPLLPVPVGDTRWRAEVALGEERLLASGIYQDGGWRLLLSGRPRPTLRVNGPLVGAWLPPGRWRLDLLYWPPGFLPGVLLAALAAVGLLVWLAPPPAAPLPPRRERRGEAAA